MQKFLVEAGLYKYTGLNLDDLKHRPHNEAADYLKIVSLFTQDEINRAKQQKVNTQKGSR